MICRFVDGEVEVGTPDKQGLRECRFQGEIIGMIKSLGDGRHQIVVKQGLPTDKPFDTLTNAAGTILAAHTQFQRKSEETQGPVR